MQTVTFPFEVQRVAVPGLCQTSVLLCIFNSGSDDGNSCTRKRKTARVPIIYQWRGINCRQSPAPVISLLWVITVTGLCCSSFSIQMAPLYCLWVGLIPFPRGPHWTQHYLHWAWKEMLFLQSWKPPFLRLSSVFSVAEPPHRLITIVVLQIPAGA